LSMSVWHRKLIVSFIHLHFTCQTKVVTLQASSVMSICFSKFRTLF